MQHAPKWASVAMAVLAPTTFRPRRIKSGLSQKELADKMGTSQSSIVRLESGTSMPSMTTLNKFAEATNCQLQIQFKPSLRGLAKWCSSLLNGMLMPLSCRQALTLPKHFAGGAHTMQKLALAARTQVG